MQNFGQNKLFWCWRSRRQHYKTILKVNKTFQIYLLLVILHSTQQQCFSTLHSYCDYLWKMSRMDEEQAVFERLTLSDFQIVILFFLLLIELIQLLFLNILKISKISFWTFWRSWSTLVSWSPLVKCFGKSHHLFNLHNFGYYFDFPWLRFKHVTNFH